jgi:hypothetical protein
MRAKYIWDPGKMEQQRQFIHSELGLTVASEYDKEGRINADSDPKAEYQIYLAQAPSNKMRLFVLEDFQEYIAGLQKPPRFAVFETL